MPALLDSGGTAPPCIHKSHQQTSVKKESSCSVDHKMELPCSLMAEPPGEKVGLGSHSGTKGAFSIVTWARHLAD